MAGRKLNPRTNYDSFMLTEKWVPCAVRIGKGLRTGWKTRGGRPGGKPIIEKTNAAASFLAAAFAMVSFTRDCKLTVKDCSDADHARVHPLCEGFADRFLGRVDLQGELAFGRDDSDRPAGVGHAGEEADCKVAVHRAVRFNGIGIAVHVKAGADDPG